MSGFIPHTPNEIGDMLQFLGLSNIDDLFSSIPSSLILARESLNLPAAQSEFDVISNIETMASKNKALSSNLISFAGGGAYDHDIPAAVKSLASRSEFVTAYTPYQPEVAQGVLQALFEYQTLISRLSGLPISNASLYDGASALVEAINLTVAQKKDSTVWISQGINPSYREVVKTFAKGSGHKIVEIPIRHGNTEWPLSDGTLPGTIVIGYPSYLGIVEDLSTVIDFAQAHDIRVIFVYDPVSMAILRPPGQLGADVAVAEGQPFGVGLNFGGPYLGLFSIKDSYTRLLPGRLIGETIDGRGQIGYVTTLRTREQDIRREKASSNVCTNQTLIAITAAITMSWLGKSGAIELAHRCYSATQYLKDQISDIEGLEIYSTYPTVREFAVKPKMPVDKVIEHMVDEGFIAGIAIQDGFENSDVYGSLLISVTEKRSKSEIDAFADSLRRVLK